MSLKGTYEFKEKKQGPTTILFGVRFRVFDAWVIKLKSFKLYLCEKRLIQRKREGYVSV